MLGVFALVVMTLGPRRGPRQGRDRLRGNGWDGTAVIQAKQPQTSEEQKRFAMSPGFRYEDLPRLTAPNPKVLAFLPRATKRSSVKTPGGIERMFVTGVTPEYARYMNRPIQSGRGPHRGRPEAAEHRRGRRRDARGEALRRRRPRRARHRRRGRPLPDRRPPGPAPDLQRGDLLRRQRHPDPARDLHGPDGPDAPAHAASPSSSRERATSPRSRPS